MNVCRKFLGYLPGIVRRPFGTLDSLAQERSVWIGFMPMAIYAGLAIIHWIIFGVLYGWDYLGTKPLLSDPIFVGGFGYWKVKLDQPWMLVPLWCVLNPLIWVVVAGFAQVITRLWDGKGAFEQGLNTLGFTFFVPLILIQSVSEWIFTIPANTLSGDRYWWVNAMTGGYGPTVSILWNAFVIGIYGIATYTWVIVLSIIAIKRVQRVSYSQAIVAGCFTFFVALFLYSTFVR